MPEHRIGTREEWQAARDELARLEAEQAERNEEIKRKRLDLPWVAVEKQYQFDTEDGKETLADLFDGRSQLLAYNIMFGPGYTHAHVQRLVIRPPFEPSPSLPERSLDPVGEPSLKAQTAATITATTSVRASGSAEAATRGNSCLRKSLGPPCRSDEEPRGASSTNPTSPGWHRCDAIVNGLTCGNGLCCTDRTTRIDLLTRSPVATACGKTAACRSP